MPSCCFTIAMMPLLFALNRMQRRRAATALVLAVVLLCSAPPLRAAERTADDTTRPSVQRPAFELSGEPEESILEQGAASTLQFLIELSGHVHKEQFNNTRAILTLSIPPDTSTNPYLLTIEGYPQRNSCNTFFWNSEATTMTALGGDIVSELKPAVGIRAGIHFFFLSPVLLEKRVFMTQLEKQRKAQAEAVALPTKIFAQAGKITLSLHEGHVSGTIVMHGFDDVERSFITYSATFSGLRTNRLRPKEELKKQ